MTRVRVTYGLWLVVALAGSVALWPTAESWVRDVARLWQGTLAVADVGSADHWLARLFASLLWLICVSVVAGLLIALGGRLPGVAGHFARRASGIVLPQALARIAAGACGFAVVLTPIVAEAATPGPTPTSTTVATPAMPAWPTDPAPTTSSTTSPGPSSGRPATDAGPPAISTVDPPAAAAITPTASAPEGSTTVRPGDSLWLITARRLGPTATPREIAEQWPLLYQANADVIGSDPHLIKPGQVLRPA